MLPALVVEGSRIVLEEHTAEAGDAPQRGPQIVRHGITEGIELPVTPLELVHQQGTRLRHPLRCPGVRGLHLFPQQRLAYPAVLVFKLLPANLRPHARLDHLEVAGFRQVVVRTRAQPLHHCLPVLERREHDQWDIPDHRRRLDPTAGLLAANARHQEIEKNAVDQLHSQQRERLLTASRQYDVVSVRPQHIRKGSEEGLAVIDRENPSRATQADRVGRGGRQAAEGGRELRQHHRHRLLPCE